MRNKGEFLHRKPSSSMRQDTPDNDALEIVVINLARSRDRRETMQDILAPLGFPFRFFDAVDGRITTHPLFSRYNEREALMRRGIKMSSGELGCFASHYLVWQMCVAKNRSLLICEDDILLGPNFKASYHFAEEKLHQYDFLRFTAHKMRRHVRCEKVREDLQIVRYERPPLGASCYALTPYAAGKLLSTCDTWFEPLDLHIDRFWLHGLLPRGFMPPPVIHAAEADDQSYIRRDALPEPKDRRFRLLRLFYKLKDETALFFTNLAFVGRWKSTD